MPTANEVQEFVVDHLQTHFPKSRKTTLDAKTNLIAAGILDSFAFLELVAEVEKKFAVEIDVGSHDFEEFTTLGGFCNAVGS